MIFNLEFVQMFLSISFISIGVLLTFLSILYLFLYSDPYIRSHFMGLIDTGGVIFIIVGAMIYSGMTIITLKLFVLLFLILLISPFATYLIMRVLLLDKVVPTGAKIHEKVMKWEGCKKNG